MRYTRLCLARLFVLLAINLLRPTDWAWDRLWSVNGSLKMQIAAYRKETGI
jgi:hypothetical protein